MQHEPGVLCVGLGVEPIGPQLSGPSDPPPVPHEASVAEKTADDLQAIEPVQIGVWLCPGEMHRPYPHILVAMSCSSLPTASA